MWLDACTSSLTVQHAGSLSPCVLTQRVCTLLSRGSCLAGRHAGCTVARASGQRICAQAAFTYLWSRHAGTELDTTTNQLPSSSVRLSADIRVLWLRILAEGEVLLPLDVA